METKRRQHLIFYPMAGKLKEQFPNLVQTLIYVDHRSPSRADLIRWLMRRFSLSSRYAENIYTVLLKTGGLVERRGKKCILTREGKSVVASLSPKVLFRIYAERFIGFYEMLSILHEETEGKEISEFKEDWGKETAKCFKVKWGPKTLEQQFRRRLDWLRSLRLVDMVGGRAFLTKEGMETVMDMLQEEKVSPRERREVEHEELVRKMERLGKFFYFNSVKSPCVRELIPRASPLKQRLDGAWQRFVPFGGVVQFAIEVQVKGSIGDLIQRLETVAPYIQKAIIVAEEKAQNKIAQVLKEKRSLLYEKVVFFTPDEVEKLFEATTALKAFVDKIFGPGVERKE